MGGVIIKEKGRKFRKRGKKVKRKVKGEIGRAHV